MHKLYYILMVTWFPLLLVWHFVWHSQSTVDSDSDASSASRDRSRSRSASSGRESRGSSGRGRGKRKGKKSKYPRGELDDRHLYAVSLISTHSGLLWLRCWCFVVGLLGAELGNLFCFWCVILKNKHTHYHDYVILVLSTLFIFRSILHQCCWLNVSFHNYMYMYW